MRADNIESEHINKVKREASAVESISRRISINHVTRK